MRSLSAIAEHLVFQTVDQRSRYKLEACHTPTPPGKETVSKRKHREWMEGGGMEEEEEWETRGRNEGRKRWGSKGRRKEDTAEWGRKKS